MRKTIWIKIVSGLLCPALFAASAPAANDEPIDFGRDVRPILSDNCFRCHGPDAEERVTDLRLDLRESALANAIEAGSADDSELVSRIIETDPELKMPPPESGKNLTATEIETLKRWINSGATWSEHWSFVKPSKPTPPISRLAEDVVWIRNELDAFVLPKLRLAGLTPAAEAERFALLRRVTFDLTGLPPTPEELDAFISDTSLNAYERAVDRLLNSPRYGEHQARYWLDVARYGDTHGLHLDNERSIWPYRDWVVRAFNRNMPFDQFTIEQLAGDLLPNPTLDQQIATGFHRCNVTTGEGGSIDAEYLARYATDRVETTATTWLGLTAGCAACHDHKFDPISQREFYSLYAYFYSLSEKAMDGNALLPPPSVPAPTPIQQMKRAALARRLDDVERELRAKAKVAESLLPQWEAAFLESYVRPQPPTGMVVHCPLDKGVSSEIIVRTPTGDHAGQIQGKAIWDAGKQDGSLRFDGNNTVSLGSRAAFDRNDRFSVAAWVYIDGDGAADTIVSKMDDANANRGYDVYIGAKKLFVHLIHRWPNNAIRVNTTEPLYKEKWQHVCVTYDGSGKASGIRVYLNGAEQELEVTHDTLTDSIATEQPLRLGKRSTTAPLRGMLDDVRIYDRVLSIAECGALLGSDPIAEIAYKPDSNRTKSERETLTRFLLNENLEGYRSLVAKRDQLKSSIQRHEGQYPSTLVMQEMSTPRQAHVLIRGQYDQPGDAVTPGVPSSLPPLPANAPANRLALAKWLVAPDHPLTARVTVNRIWQRYFGTGIVATSEDFGSQGEWPSHPQLLDWLAVSFIESGWNVKELHRKIVCSATYRQSARVTSRKLQLDPYNRLLSRGPRFRIDAEMVRDNALAISGLLVDYQGGRGVKPYQPGGLWEAVGYTSSNTARFKRDDHDALYRRSLYTFWKRTSPPPSMQILDAPSREVCTAKRPRTNTAAAALLLMNDIQFIEAAQSLAHRVLVAPELTTVPQRLARLFRLATSRRPSPDEQAVLLELLAQFQKDYEGDAEAAQKLLNQGETTPLLDVDSATAAANLKAHSLAERAAWTMLASTVLNLDATWNK